jgi:hypothetical protein
MRKLVPVDWEWNEDFARQMGTEQQGYYKIPDLVRCHVISPDEAEELFLHHNWSVQRKFDDRHAERLASEMVVAVEISVALGPDNFPRIVNGQHTLWGMYMAGRPMQVTVTPYMCRDDIGMANCYAIFDSNKTRSAATIIDTQKQVGGIDIAHSATRHHKWAQCVACAENDFNQPKKQQTNTAKAAQAARPEVIAFAKWIEARIESNNQIKGLLPMGIGACFYAMYKADPIKAEQFLKMYLSGVGLTENHPILILIRRLTINKPVAEHGATACRLHAEIAYTCWRKFCLGEPLMATRRTIRLPKWNNWRIYVGPAKATLRLGGSEVKVEVPR